MEKQGAESLQQQIGPLNYRIQELGRSLQQRMLESEGNRQRIETARRESERLGQDIAAGQAQVRSLRASHEDLLHLMEVSGGEMEITEAELASRRQTESRLTQEAAGIEVRIAQFDLRLENVSSQVSERYHVDLQQFLPDVSALLGSIEEQRQAVSGSRRLADLPDRGQNPPLLADAEPDWRFVEEVLPELRRRLESLGSVNLDAIVEFEELEDRFQLIRRQHEDLVRFRDELSKILSRINRTTCEMFSKTFEQVADHFRTMFTELFGGGAQAALVLLDEQDPLECGIDIIAKPPGKKLQSIDLLSGGERSMTAVALLFAIYMVKPAPFCVLDELDAPLDDANIARFCRVLDRFCNQSQFIIVTHSKRTMHRADVIFGISMEERGVSKILSVRLSRDKGMSEPAIRGH